MCGVFGVSRTGFHNRQRRHSTLGMPSPANYEQLSLLGG